MMLFDALLAWIEGEGAALFWSGFLVFVRVGAMVALVPVFGEQSIPVRLRLGVALGLTLVVSPAIAAPVAPDVLSILAEALTGLILGAGIRLFIHALQVAGTIAALSISLGQMLGVAGADPAPAISHLLSVAALALLVTLGFHLRLVELLVYSYELFPQGTFPDAGSVASWGVAHVARIFGLGFSLAMPFMIGATLYYVALGAINRAMPTLMVAFIGAPALTGGGLLFLALTAPAILAVWLAAVTAWFEAPMGIVP
jgi:flagellar biosynthetic protein FliR